MNILNILDRLIESKMASWEWRLGGGEIEQKGERTHGCGQHSVVTAWGREYKGTKW